MKIDGRIFSIGLVQLSLSRIGSLRAATRRVLITFYPSRLDCFLPLKVKVVILLSNQLNFSFLSYKRVGVWFCECLEKF